VIVKLLLQNSVELKVQSLHELLKAERTLLRPSNGYGLDTLFAESSVAAGQGHRPVGRSLESTAAFFANEGQHVLRQEHPHH